MLEHGGRLLRAAAATGTRLEDWLDLSTGINPLPWPTPAVPASCWSRLPEDDDGLVASAVEYYGAPTLLPVNGTQNAIQLIPRLRPAGKVAVLSPAYAEHAHGWNLAGHEVIEPDLAELESCLDLCDVVVVVNPNNPTGTLLSSERLLGWLERLQSHAGWLVVDEAFMDATPEHSLAPETDRKGLIVLKSFGKFFGCPGARLGFVAARPDFLADLNEQLGPWAVSGPARWMAKEAFADQNWHVDTRQSLQESSYHLATLLSRYGLMPAGGTALFQWVLTPFARGIHDYLIDRRILVRRFDSPMSLRLGLPGTKEGWERLAQVLAELPEAFKLTAVSQ